MTELPSCPRCGQNDRVVPLEAPVARPGRPLYDADSAWPYECAGCVLLFTGTDDEWVRMGPVRQKLREDQAKRNVPKEIRS